LFKSITIESLSCFLFSSGGLWSSLSSLVGSKSLSRNDINPVISKMQDHLISKNVASDVAVKLCESVAAKLEGKVMGTFSVCF
jgi:signal recognition particle receptor subunit alpha